MRPRSLRARLLVVLLATLAVSALVVPVAVALSVRAYLDDRAQDRLSVVVAAVGGALSGRQDVDVPVTRVEALLPPGGAVVAVTADEGEPLVVRGTDGDALPDAAELVAAGRGLEAGEVREVGGVSPYLVARTPTAGLEVGDRPVSELVVATGVRDDRDLFRRLLVTSVVAGAAGLLVAGGLAGTLLHRRLRPLAEMAEAARDPGRGEQPDLADLSRGAGTEVEALAAALDRAFADRAAAQARLRAVVADASHELRTPVTTIAGWVDLWAQGALADPQRLDAALHRIEAETDRMRLLVDELGLLARLDAAPALHREAVDVARLAAEVVEDSRVVSPDADIRCSASGPVVAAVDPPRLQQVLRNLVGNAVQHNPTGTSVVVDVERDGDDLVLRVRDDGRGIAAEDLPRVFDRFWRAAASRSRAESGSGLGLAIVEGVVRAHGGAVDVRSALGEGTTVEVRVPSADRQPG